MTTTTATAKVYTCKVLYTADTLSVTSPGGKCLMLHLPSVDALGADGLTSEESAAMFRVMAGPPGAKHDVAIDTDDMRLLVSIREKYRKPQQQQTAVIATPTVAEQTVAKVAEQTERRTIGSGIDEPERRLSQLRRACESLKGGVSALAYDIPKTSEHGNPSRILWHYGFRLSESVWVLTDASLASPVVRNLLDGWRRPGSDVTVDVVPYDEKAIDQIRAICVRKLSEELTRVHTALIKRIDSADKALGAAIDKLAEAEHLNTQAKRDAETKKRHKKVRQIIREATDSLKAAINCAQQFDETDRVADLLAGLRAAIRSEAQAFNAVAKAAAVKPVPVPAE